MRVRNRDWLIGRARDHLVAAAAILCDPMAHTQEGLAHAMVLTSLAQLRIASADPTPAVEDRALEIVREMIDARRGVDMDPRPAGDEGGGP